MKMVSSYLAASLGLAALASAQSLPRYTVTAVPTLGGSASVAFGINDAGRVGGGANVRSEDQHPFISVMGGLLYDIGTLGGHNGNVAGPNSSDQLGGLSETSQQDPNGEDFCGYGTHLLCRGLLWSGTAMALPPLAGGNNSEGLNLNNLGQVAGVAETGITDSTCAAPQMLQYEAAVWDSTGRVTELPPLPGDTVGFALGLNNTGLVVGSSGTCANTPLLPVPFGPHAVVWDHGVPMDIGSFGGSAINAAAAVNDLGQVVGGSTLPDNQTVHSYMWSRATGMQDMGTLKGDSMALPASINNSGQVTGASCDSQGNCRAFYWQNNSMTDLNTMIPANSPLYLLFGYWINTSGSIAGLALDTQSGNTVGFVATPCSPHDGSSWCKNGVVSAEMPRAVLPENARRELRRRLPRPQDK